MNHLRKLPKGEYISSNKLYPILDIHAREFYQLDSSYNFLKDLSSRNKKPLISLKKVIITRKT